MGIVNDGRFVNVEHPSATTIPSLRIHSHTTECIHPTRQHLTRQAFFHEAVLRTADRIDQKYQEMYELERYRLRRQADRKEKERKVAVETMVRAARFRERILQLRKYGMLSESSSVASLESEDDSAIARAITEENRSKLIRWDLVRGMEEVQCEINERRADLHGPSNRYANGVVATPGYPEPYRKIRVSRRATASVHPISGDPLLPTTDTRITIEASKETEEKDRVAARGDRET